MKTSLITTSMFLAVCAMTSCQSSKETPQANTDEIQTVGNPYLPMWEHIPDGEPYVFEDPDNPGKMRAYIYGSHDSRLTDYCGRELVVWSAAVEDLNHWRYDGEILVVDKNAKGEALYPDSTKGDVLFAPDVAVKVEADGTKTYYLYPNDQAGGRNSLVAKSKSPKGPFEVCNWSDEDPNKTVGPLGFDPGVFVDDDGRVYGYWGFMKSYMAELDPETMCTVKAGTEVLENQVSGTDDEGIFHFFEASSMRKIKDKYVLIYSRFMPEGEFNMPRTNYTLAYAYSDKPLGPWTYGGTIIDGRAREKDEQGNAIASATVTGNTHGSICEINGQWYVFYHRQTGYDEYARQAMVAPITVKVEEGAGGKVMISEGEVTSEGFSLEGLDPLERHSAAICCWHTGPKATIHGAPKTYFGSFIDRGYGTDDKFEHPYALHNNTNPVVNNTDGSIVGYKYFNLSKLQDKKDVKLSLNLTPEGIDGVIRIMVDRPWVSQGGKEVGRIELKADMPKTLTEMTAPVGELAKMSGKHAIFFVFESATKEKSMCVLENFAFVL
ncbi:MAG: family 43 glycosylhydrolase [Bacteroidaceae bacterium]|nr:family 43 glycosylhydrolase [Bacteroidaceae bacterium]